LLPPYDFAETLSRLEDIGQWLDSLGFTRLDRIRVYGRNIRKMFTAHDAGEIEALQESIALSDARETLWSYIDADEFGRAGTALRNELGDDLAAAPIQQALSGPADLFLENANNSSGRNFMFELIMAGRLAGAGFRPAFDKGPDVETTFA